MKKAVALLLSLCLLLGCMAFAEGAGFTFQAALTLT